MTGLATLWGISRFARLREVPAHVFVPLFIAIYIPTSIIVLVPIDIVAAESDDNIFYLPEHARLVIWRIFYWLTFVLTWVILPVLMYYVESGHYDAGRKLAEALRRNLRMQAIIIGSGVVFMLYVVMTSGLSLMSIKSVAIALSYSYALVLAIWLLGHGLINVPRDMWSAGDAHSRLSQLYTRAVKTCDAYAEARANYDEVAAEILALQPFKDGQYGQWIGELLGSVADGPTVSRTGLAEARPGVGTAGGGGAARGTDGAMTEAHLSSLSRRYFLVQARENRARAEWQKLLRDAAKAEDIVQAGASLEFRYSKTYLPSKLAAVYYRRVHKYVMRAVSGALAVMSVGLVWSELVHGTAASLVNLVVAHTTGFWQQLLSGVFLAYMCWCAFASLTNIRVFNVYALVHKGSDLQSLLFYGMYACRLTVPLSYNFLTLIASHAPVFDQFLGKSINLTPLGMYFNDWLPRLIVVPMALTWFHFYDKMRDYLGFGLGVDDDEDGDESVSGSAAVEGRELVSRALTDSRFRWAYEGVADFSYDQAVAPRSSITLGAYRDSPRLGTPSSDQADDASEPDASLLGGRRLNGVFSALGGVPSRVRDLFGSRDRPQLA